MIHGLLGSVGIEIETGFKKGEFVDLMRGTHDASIESPALVCEGFIFLKKPELAFLTRKLVGQDECTIGEEFISDPYSSPKELYSAIQCMVRAMYAHGEPDYNPRAGIHVHIGWAYDIYTLKTAVRMILWTESLLFHLAGLRQSFRGITNNAAYCRPLSMFGPPVVKSNLGTVQLTDSKSLLACEEPYEFWNAYGAGSALDGEVVRYHPARYMAVNLYSVLLHGTMEFRHFNVTKNPGDLDAIVRLCQALTRLTQTSKELPDKVNSVYLVTDPNENHGILDELMDYIHLKPETVKTLHEILDKTPMPTLEKKYVRSHLWGTGKDKVNYERRLLPDAKLEIDGANAPNNIDCHMLDKEYKEAYQKAAMPEMSYLKKMRDNYTDFLHSVYDLTHKATDTVSTYPPGVLKLKVDKHFNLDWHEVQEEDQHMWIEDPPPDEEELEDDEDNDEENNDDNEDPDEPDMLEDVDP